MGNLNNVRFITLYKAIRDKYSKTEHKEAMLLAIEAYGYCNNALSSYMSGGYPSETKIPYNDTLLNVYEKFNSKVSVQLPTGTDILIEELLNRIYHNYFACNYDNKGPSSVARNRRNTPISVLSSLVNGPLEVADIDSNSVEYKNVTDLKLALVSKQTIDTILKSDLRDMLHPMTELYVLYNTTDENSFFAIILLYIKKVLELYEGKPTL